MWTLVPLPTGPKPVACKWVSRTKLHPNGAVAIYKARLVAKDFTQTRGIDYNQTFSPVVKYESIRAMLAIVTQQRMHLTQFDIQTAYLNGLLDSTIYMLQPSGFEAPSKNGVVLVRLLLCSLYGL